MQLMNLLPRLVDRSLPSVNLYRSRRRVITIYSRSTVSQFDLLLPDLNLAKLVIISLFEYNPYLTSRSFLNLMPQSTMRIFAVEKYYCAWEKICKSPFPVNCNTSQSFGIIFQCIGHKLSFIRFRHAASVQK